MKSELLIAIDLVAKEKDISRDVLLDAVEVSLLTASRNHFGKADNVKVEMNRDTGEYRLYAELEVVENVEDKVLQISLEDARAMAGPKVELGDIVQREIQSREFGRIAAQNAKSVIMQKIREEERKSILERYSSKYHEIVTGFVQRINGRTITVNLGRADAILTENEQVRTEHYRVNDRIKVYVLDVKDSSRSPKILVSRTHPELVRRLFEAEVTEIQDGIVEIKAIAREAGSRTKMAVWSNDDNVDAIGACVGVSGSRVNAVVDELNGEKIDIINWSDNSAELIENALSPAKVIVVLADDEDKSATVVVPDNQLSLAIGKIGQNARLAAKLTGYKIDIKNETQARESGLFEEIGYIDDYFDMPGMEEGVGEIEFGEPYDEYEEYGEAEEDEEYENGEYDGEEEEYAEEDGEYSEEEGEDPGEDSEEPLTDEE